MRLLRIKADKGGKRLTLVTDGEERYSVSEAFYVNIGSPAIGDEISEGILDEIISEDEEYRCMKRALSILAYADNNRQTLKRKLRHAGFSSSVSERCTDQCVRLGYIDEARQLRRLIKEEAEVKLRGRRYITAKLVSKGYSGALVERVIDELSDLGEVDFDRSLARLNEKLGDGTEKTKIQLMYKYGYK